VYATHADGLKGMVALGARIRSQCAVNSRELAIGLATRQGGVAATRVAELEDKVLDMQRLVAAVELNKELLARVASKELEDKVLDMERHMSSTLSRGREHLVDTLDRGRARPRRVQPRGMARPGPACRCLAAATATAASPPPPPPPPCTDRPRRHARVRTSS
jgi:hypothetical protein